MIQSFQVILNWQESLILHKVPKTISTFFFLEGGAGMVGFYEI